MKFEFGIVDIELLLEHELVIEERVKKLSEEIKKEGVVKIPIPVEREHYVILDGHHRFHALKRLGCKKVPIYVFDYFDNDIIVDVWDGAIVDKVEKKEVVERALSKKPFPPKTTRHIFKEKLPEKRIKIEELLG